MTLSRDDLDQVERVAVYVNRRYYENILEIFITLVAGAVAGLVVSTTSPAPQNTVTNSTTSPDQSQQIPAGEWVKPLNRPMFLTSGFGGRMHPVLKTWKQHNGSDYRCKQGDPILAVFGGNARRVVNSACGNGYVVTNGEYSASYCHLHFFTAPDGPVKPGQKIGGCGTTGRSTGDHLHLGIKHNGQWIDPHKELKRRGLIK